jgi:hypothetical protein
MKQKNIFMRWLDKRRPLSLLFLLSLLMSSSLGIRAEVAKWSIPDDAKILSKTKNTISFGVFLLETKGDNNYSFWTGDPEIYIDDVKMCNFSNIGIPVYTGDRDAYKKAIKKYHDDNDEGNKNNPIGCCNPNYWTSIQTYGPSYYDNSQEYWTNVAINLGWNQEGTAHKIEIKGEWISEQRDKSNADLIYYTNENKINTFPACEFSRTNKAVTFKASGLTKDGDWRYAFAMYDSESRTSMSEDNNSKNYGYWDTDVNATDITQTMTTYKTPVTVTYGFFSKTQYVDSAFNNYKPITFYTRIYNWKVSTVNYHGKQSHFVFYKDEDIIVPGFPRASSLKIETTDAYTKKVKISWSSQVSDSNHSDTNGIWRIFRMKKGDDTSLKALGDVSYGTLNFVDNDAEKEYYDESTNEKTEYVYTVCFVPSGWTVNSESDASGLSASQTFQLQRSFAFSNLVTKADKTSITFSWNHTRISDASSSKTYKLTVQRSTDANNWSDAETKDISSSTTESGTYTDNKDLKAYQTYYYRLKINVQGRDFISEEKTTQLSGGTTVPESSFKASRGTYSSAVKIQWAVDQVGSEKTYFTLQRRPLASTNDNDFVDIYSTSGTESSYSYDDQTAQPGAYYKYRLVYYVVHDGNKLGEAYVTTDGFSISTGVVSGRVYYDSGTAVEGVKVSLTPSNADGNTVSQFRSLKFGGEASSGINYAISSNTELKTLMGGNFTLQMYVNPTSSSMNKLLNGKDTVRYPLFDVTDKFSIYLVYDENKNRYKVVPNVNREMRGSSTFFIPADKWTQLTAVYTASDSVVKLYNTTSDTTIVSSVTGKGKVYIAKVNNVGLSLCNYGWLGCATPYSGYVDEFRMFNKALSESEIKKNFNHTLSGTEDGLVIYWPMDENLGAQTVAYDYSKTNGVTNGRVGTLKVAATSSDIVPNADQLNLCTYTDAEGNYMVRGIPFSGEGTNYVVAPTLGVHTFNPSSSSRFISLNSLVHSGVDFKDNSSFPVSGKVRYSNTTIPVEGISIYVDGIIASKDGNPVTTASDGTYTVDVPIGDHFITVKKNGHTFDGDGRYPTDSLSVGTKHTFESAVSNLDFFDNTTVVVAGRVAGGDVEYAKPLGLGKGNANIGKAVITLDFKDDPDKAIYIHAKREATGNSYQYVQDTSKRTFETVNSLGKAYVAENKNVITIETDSLSGEFAVKLPPLKYTSKSITIPSQKDITFTNSDIDATNAILEYTDSAKNSKNGYDRFKYNASLKKEYRSTSNLDIKEHTDGSFGIDKYTVTDINGKKEEVPVYTVNADTIKYTFGYPVYEQLGQYTYDVYAYEKYENMDSKNAEGKYNVDEVPLGNIDVTISNQFAATTTVKLSDGSVGTVTDDTFTLDSLGRAKYTFIAGLPNIHDPYTRTINASYKVDGTQLSWNKPFEAVVLGALNTGNNFTTKGPDEVMMVLRDPPGSQSQTVYEKGTQIVKTTSVSATASSQTGLTTNIYTGVKQEVATGFGVLAIQNMDAKQTFSVGAELNVSYNRNNSTTKTLTTTQDISTSDEADYVGANGDVFIGSAKNLIFGACHNVIIKKDEAAGNYKLTMADGITTGEEFTTSFNYTTYMIENSVIPNFEKLRNALLTKVADVNSVAAGSDPKYVTTLDESDDNYGKDNDDKVWGKDAVSFTSMKNGKFVGKSYTMILPADYKSHSYQDMVKYYNTQITLWKNELAKNEEAKVKAITHRDTYLDKNYSLDAGASITSTVETDTCKEHTNENNQEANVILATEAGCEFNGVGVVIDMNETVGTSVTETQTSSKTQTTSMSYTLKDTDAGNTHSIDVYNAPDNFGPIFSTRAGATSAPFEDEIVTKYYKPGTVISSKTLQVEKPELEVLDPIVTGIPAGKEATFRVALRNNSDTKDDNYYGLRVESDTNPDGAQIFMDGLNITSGAEILVPYGTMTKTLTIRQSKKDVLEYKNIGLRFYSVSQPDDTGTFPGIYSIGKVSAYFQPTCSDIALAASTAVVNTASEAPLTLSVSNYDYSMESLKGIRLEYKGENDADFRTLQEYSKDTTKVAADKNLMLLPALTGSNKLTYTVDLRNSNFSDQTYVFRAVTICNQGGTEVNNESDEINVVRDMSRPQLIATPTPSTGVLHSGDDIAITFNEDIRKGILTSDGNFSVVGVMNNSKVAHSVALSLTGAEQAKSDATVDLSNKSFSADLWLNYSADGKLFQHGTKDNYFSAAIESGKLAVSVNGTKVSSTVAMPKDKWIYLNISYDNSGSKPVLNAGYAQDASTTKLISNQEVATYLGNGPVSLGGDNLTAKIQEFSLWNTVRSLTDALADKDETKSQYTSGIIGYWQFNEGHGTVAQDRSRSRNITLPSSNAWWISGANYAAVLNGKTAVKASIGSIPTTASDSYLLEGWFRADKAQTGVASIMSVGDTTLNIRLNTAGTMELVAKGTTTSLNATDMRDGQWHHLALNVLKSTNGSAIVYLDGKAIRQFSAAAIPALQGDALILGGHRTTGTGITLYDSFLNGGIDEVRIWNGRRTADVITSLMYSRVSEKSEGLVAYYPMEKSALDANNQVQTTGDAADHTGKSADLTFVTSEAGAVTPAVYASASTPSLTLAPALENVAFSYVASERQIKINLDEQPSKLEGCTVYITAKDIKDLHSNSVLPITWSVYVNQDNLQWDESAVTVNKTNSETATFSMGIENESAASEPFAISGMPTWLTVNTESGTLSALGKKTLTFSVGAGVAIGTYETTVYLTGSQNIATPLNITLNVTGEAPQWTAQPGELTMNVVGQVVIDGVYSSDPNDIIAAFRGQECVGVAQPKYYARYDSYIALMNIYGSQKDAKTPLTYKIYDASTGQIYPSVSASKTEANTFVADTWAGSFADRVLFTPLDKIEQDLSLNRTGWKWFSFYVTPDKNTVDGLFNDVNDCISIINGNTASSKYENGLWVGNITSFSNEGMYKLNAAKAYTKTVIGKACKPADVAITLNNAWTWIGYPASASNSLDAAFAGAEPQDGDIVKTQSAFSVYTGGEWVGTLDAMTPGTGYNYYSNASAAKTFHFPVPVQAGNVKKAMRVTAAADSVETQPALDFQNNMTMIAVVKDGSALIDDAQISVYAGNELRGKSTAAVTDGKYFLTIGGDNNEEQLSFVVTTAEGDVMLAQKATYSPDAQLGSMADPYVLDLSNATSIANVSGLNIKCVEIYDINGRLIEKKENPVSLYTKKDLEGRVSGVYIQKVTYTSGETVTMRLYK